MFKKLTLLALLPLSLSAMEQAPQQPVQQFAKPRTESRSDRAIRFGLIGKVATYAVGVAVFTGSTTVATIATANPALGLGAGMWMSGAWFPVIEATSNNVAAASALLGAATHKEE